MPRDDDGGAEATAVALGASIAATKRLRRRLRRDLLKEIGAALPPRAAEDVATRAALRHAVSDLVAWSAEIALEEVTGPSGKGDLQKLLPQLNDCVMRSLATLVAAGVGEEALQRCFDDSGCRGCRAHASDFLRRLRFVSDHAGKQAAVAAVNVLFPRPKRPWRSSVGKYVAATVALSLLGTAAWWAAARSDGLPSWSEASEGLRSHLADAIRFLEQAFGARAQDVTASSPGGAGGKGAVGAAHQEGILEPSLPWLWRGGTVPELMRRAPELSAATSLLLHANGTRRLNGNGTGTGTGTAA